MTQQVDDVYDFNRHLAETSSSDGSGQYQNSSQSELDYKPLIIKSIKETINREADTTANSYGRRLTRRKLIQALSKSKRRPRSLLTRISPPIVRLSQMTKKSNPSRFAGKCVHRFVDDLNKARKLYSSRSFKSSLRIECGWLMEKYMKSEAETLIPYKSFDRLVRQLLGSVSGHSTATRLAPGAVALLMYSSVDFMTRFFEQCSLAIEHRNRITLRPKDLRLTIRMDDYYSTLGLSRL